MGGHLANLTNLDALPEAMGSWSGMVVNSVKNVGAALLVGGREGSVCVRLSEHTEGGDAGPRTHGHALGPMHALLG